MEEYDGTFYINYGEEKLEARRDNTSLFMFWGDLASRNHVFVQMEETDDNTTLGSYLFDPDCEWFDAVATHMINHGFTAHMNLPEVPDCDEQAYQRYINQRVAREAEEMGDYLPEGFEDGAA